MAIKSNNWANEQSYLCINEESVMNSPDIEPVLLTLL